MERWVDFSRNLTAGDERQRMLEHLAAGCEECSRLSELTDRLISTCGSISVCEVPEKAVRLARAIFPVHHENRPKRGSRLPVELLFDSFLAPVPVGLRATWQVGWQGLYRSGECSLDVRIEPDLKSSKATVIGQVASHVAPTEEMGNLQVSLRSGRRVVAETVSNRFGEFQMEYEQEPQLKLVVQLQDAHTIQVPLRKLSSDKPAAKSRASLKKR